jgi:hypothetical protein
MPAPKTVSAAQVKAIAREAHANLADHQGSIDAIQAACVKRGITFDDALLHRIETATANLPAKSKPCEVFTRNREVITRYSGVRDDEADILAVWAIGTHCFGPATTWPVTWPYLYITGEAGSGKTVLGQDIMGMIARQWRSATGTTGSTLFRMCGREDEETGEIENYAPLLCIDEIDTTFAGAKDEDLRRALNAGYKRGATIPRSAGKSSIDFPIYGPKLMMGIDNGHLPETVTQRSVRIELEKMTQDEKVSSGIEDFFIFDVELETEEIQQMNNDWAKAHSLCLREYRPQFPSGLTARQWEIARSLVQLASEMGSGMEARIVRALVSVFNRKRGQESAKQRLYSAVAQWFELNDSKNVTTRELMAHLDSHGIGYPGHSGKGLASLLSSDGIGPKSIWRVDEAHPDGKSHRGYQRYQFDQAFVDYLPDDEADDE